MKPRNLAPGNWPNRLLKGGAVAVLLGFAWFAAFVGLPYPDPTPAQYRHQQLHSSVSDAMMLGGILAIAVGLAAGLITWALDRGRRRSR